MKLKNLEKIKKNELFPFNTSERQTEHTVREQQ